MKRKKILGTSQWSSVKNLPSNVGDEGWIPGWGTKISRATKQLSTCATNTAGLHTKWRLRAALSPSPAKKEEIFKNQNAF